MTDLELRQWCLITAYQARRRGDDTRKVIAAAEAIYKFVVKPTVH